MTEAALVKKIKYFFGRMKATRVDGPRSTPQNKRAYTLARHKWREARRQLICLQATGSIRGWHEIRLPDKEDEA